MAFSSANHVAQTNAVDNAAKNSASAAQTRAKGPAFTDALDEVLTKSHANDDADNASAAQKAATAKTKSKKNTTPDAAAGAQAAPQPAATSGTHGIGKVTQAKLAAALAKAASAPILKTGAADGSAVPNNKIGTEQDTADGKPQANPADTIAALAAKIAATSAATDTSAAPAAAKGVATAEVAAHRTATATPGITKIEAAAMSTATDTALHAAAPKAKIEAQALPVQFDAKSAKADDGKNGAQGDGDKGGKDSADAGTARTAALSAKQTDTAQTAFSDTQPAPQNTAPAPQPAASPHAATDIAAVNGASSTSTPTAPIATTLHVAQTAQPNVTQQAPDLAALGVSIAAKSRDGEKQFDIKMDPAELGRVDVRISVDSAGKAQAHLTAEKPQTLQLLQNDRTTLERSLRDAGLDLSNNGLNFSLKGEQQSATPTFVARNRALSIAAVQTTDAVSSHSGSSIAPGDSRLDIRV